MGYKLPSPIDFYKFILDENCIYGILSPESVCPYEVEVDYSYAGIIWLGYFRPKPRASQ